MRSVWQWLALPPALWLAPLLVLVLASAPGYAHEGHEHAAEAPATDDDEAADVKAPRLALSSPHVELVAVRDGRGLLVYVDDYASNAPLVGLQIELRRGTQAWQLQALDAGTYGLAPGLLPDEGFDARLTVRAPAWQETLSGHLPAAAGAAGVHGNASRRWLAVAGAAIVFVALLIVFLRHRRRRDGRAA
ncbi:MAG: hypothetical protein ACREVL_14745 [Solimonas sp.]